VVIFTASLERKTRNEAIVARNADYTQTSRGIIGRGGLPIALRNREGEGEREAETAVHSEAIRREEERKKKASGAVT